MKNICMLLLAAFLLAACGEENNSIIKEDDEKNEEVNGNEEVNDNEEVLQPGEVMVKGSVSGETSLAESDLSVQTFWGEAQLKDGGFEVKAYDGDFPQLVYLTNGNDDVIMMRRGPVDVESMEVNEESTALALATMHPVFARITNDDLEEISGMIQGLSAYPAYLQAVKNNISAGKDIWNTENAELMTALGNLLDEFCTEVSAAKSRLSDIVGINKGHFDVKAEGNMVGIRNKGLFPSYEISVYWGGKQLDLGTDNLVKSSDSYGIMAVLAHEVGSWGEPFIVTLAEEGEYLFYLDRTTEKAKQDLSSRLFADALSIVGLETKDVWIDVLLGTEFIVTGNIINPDTQWNDWVFDFSQTFLTTGLDLKGKTSVGWEKVANVVRKAFMIYDAVKGVSNEIARIKFGFDSEPFIEFSLCQYENKVTSCTEAELTIVSGDKQTGRVGLNLDLPLVVSAKIFADDGTETPVNSNQKVKFEVVSGGGSIVNYAEIDANSNASAYWTLGGEGEQQVRAVIVDMTTGEEISQPVFFTANVKEINYKVSVALSGDYSTSNMSVLGKNDSRYDSGFGHLEASFPDEFKWDWVSIVVYSHGIVNVTVEFEVNGKLWRQYVGEIEGDGRLFVNIYPMQSDDLKLVYQDSSVFD